MESSGGAEITVFELKVCDSDVENLLRVISDCVSGAVSGARSARRAHVIQSGQAVRPASPVPPAASVRTNLENFT